MSEGVERCNALRHAVTSRELPADRSFKPTAVGSIPTRPTSLLSLPNALRVFSGCRCVLQILAVVT